MLGGTLRGRWGVRAFEKTRGQSPGFQSQALKGRNLSARQPRRYRNPGRRFALPWAISFCPFGAAGSMVDRAITETEQPDYRVCHPPGF